MELDILVIAAHPDDAELGTGGTIVKCVGQGKKVGILDLTRGELGTRGTPEIRAAEAKASAELLGVPVRENVGLPDGFLENTREHQLKILPFIRRLRPKIVLANAVTDRHPDHAKGAKLASDACFLSGLRAIKTKDKNGKDQEAWRPKAVYHFVQDYYIHADFVIDVTGEWPQKMKAIRAFESQFFTGTESSEPETSISTPGFIESLEARARDYGRPIGATFGEGFTVERPPGVDDLFDLG